MVGRHAELARLGEWYAQVKSGIRRIVFVAGEPGIGKTALVGAFLNSIARDGEVQIAHGQCVEQYGAGEPYMPVLEALTRLCREPGGNRVVKILHRLAPAWLVQMPTLIGAEDRTRLQGQAQGATQQRMLREIGEALEAMAHARPLVLLLEDLHWSDLSTLNFIAAIARRTEPARLLLLGSYRPIAMLAKDQPLRTTKHELDVHRLCEELQLRRLDEADVAAYLAQRLVQSAEVKSWERIAPVIYKRSEGNPLFMVNLVNYVVAQGQSLDASKIETPRTILQMIEHNFERLNPDEQAVLQGASVAGPEFSAAAAAAALERPQTEVESCCAHLSRHQQFIAHQGPIEWPDGTVAGSFRFLHALYQDVLYGLLPSGHRVQFHRRIAARQEAGYGERTDEAAAELAHHYCQANDRSKAIQYFRLAGERAAAKGAENEAVKHFTTALELIGKEPENESARLQEVRLRILSGPSLMAVKGLGAPETAANYTRALELCQMTDDASARFEALSGLWTFHLVRAEHHEADELAQQLLASAHECEDDSHRAFANFAAGNVAFWRGELEIAAKRLARSIAACEPGQRFRQVFVDDPTVYSRAYAAWTQHYQGLADQALASATDCLRIARIQSHPRTLAMATQFAGHLHVFRREPDVTLEHCRTLTSLATEYGLPFYEALADILAGCGAIQRGEGARGIETIKRGLAAWQRLGSALAVPWFLGELAEGLTSLGHWDEALKVTNEALGQSERTGERQFDSELYRIAGRALLSQDKAAEAENCFQRAVQLAKAQGARIWELRATMDFARLAHRRRAEARTMLAEIYNGFTEGFDIADLKDAKELLDQLSN
jgi:predicted ATPase